MSEILLDTVVLAELRKNERADPAVLAWQQNLAGGGEWLSVITLLEIRVGILRAAPRDPAFAGRLQFWLNEIVIPAFLGQLLPVDPPVAEAAAAMRVTHGLSFNDALIAATAAVHQLTLATRNVSDFAHTGIAIVNPWNP